MNYSELMKDIRFLNDKTQKDIANILGIARSTYNVFEQQYSIIPLKYLIIFCDYFNVNVDYVLGLTEIEKYPNLKKSSNAKNIGFRMRKVRRENNITQKDLAVKLHITNACLSSYEKGKNLVSTATIYTFAKYFNVSIDYLLCRNEIKKLSRNKIYN
ncbi:MAG: helix-turn-helix domain-containing protein [Ruminococcus sp.]|nr:helix-turn-helix domain-containing protein [Ruminococcus sp.]